MTRARILLTLLLLLAPLAGRAEGFLGIMEDLPLAPGLIEAPEGGLVFTTPEGRIAETQASGLAERGAVLEFYATTLPQLGWTREDDTTFRRDEDRLTLRIGPAGTGIAVHFSLSPAATNKKKK